MHKLIVHHNGVFVRSPKVMYLNGKISEFPIEEVCYFELKGIVQDDLKIKNAAQMHYRVAGQSLDAGLRFLGDDEDARKMVDSSKGGPLCLYIEHEVGSSKQACPSVPENVEVIQNGTDVPRVPEVESESEDESDFKTDSEYGGSSLDDNTDIDEEFLEARQKLRKFKSRNKSSKVAEVNNKDGGVGNVAEDEVVEVNGDGVAGLDEVVEGNIVAAEEACVLLHEQANVPPVEDEPNDEEVENDGVEIDNTGYQSDYRDSDEYDSPVEEGVDDEVELVPGKSPWTLFDPECDQFSTIVDQGTRFTSPQQLKYYLRCYAVGQSKDIRFSINSRKRVQAVCSGNCPWKLWASWMGTERSFQVKSITGEHRCIKKFTVKLANSAFISSLYYEKILANPHWKLKDFKQDVMEKYKVNVTKTKCYRAKKHALGNVDNILKEHYAKLWNYAAEIVRANPHSTVKIVGDGADGNDFNVFKRMYVCLHNVKMGWKNGCRPVIGLDGCFLKGFCKGQLLSAVGRDGNNHMYPIAWAVVETENTDSWTWFIQLLKDDLGYTTGGGLTIISDRQKGLMNAVTDLLPAAEHRNCARHIYANLRKLDGCACAQVKSYFWEAAKCSTHEEFEAIMKKMKGVNSKAEAYCRSQGVHTWSRAYFLPHAVCDSVDNNMSETFNSTIIYSRPKPIITMLEEIRVYCMSRLHLKKEEITKWHDPICPRIRKILEKNKLKHIKWNCIFNGGIQFEIRKGGLDGYVVNLEQKTCTCRQWSVSGIPCEHAICAIYWNNDDPDNYVHEHLTKQGALKAYERFINPLNGQSMWPDTGRAPLLPPLARRMPGRPKKSRRKDPHEESKRKNTHRISKAGVSGKCGRCQRRGHNARTCKTPQDELPVKAPMSKQAKEPNSKQANLPNSEQAKEPRTNRKNSKSVGKRKAPQGFGAYIDPETGDTFVKMPGQKRGRWIPKGDNNARSTQESTNVSQQAPSRSTTFDAPTISSQARSNQESTASASVPKKGSQKKATPAEGRGHFKPPRPIANSVGVKTRSKVTKG